MGWVSRAPAALSELFTAVQAAMTTDDCIVLKGPKLTAAGQRRAVIVGYEDGDNPAVEHRFASMTAGGLPLLDRFGIRCCFKVLDGDGDFDAATTAVYDLFGQFLTVLASDPFPGGLMSPCLPSSAQLEREQAGNGALASLYVTVECDSQTNLV
jgi:hypothetical protein